MGICILNDMSTTHIRTAFHMEVQRNKVCGADVHKRFLVATILSRDGTKQTQRFRMNPDELSKFRTWVVDNGCEQVAVESTGIYWIPVLNAIEGFVDLILANAYKIKNTSRPKTDLTDSEWMAELCLNGMIKPSRIFPKDDRDLRSLTRARERYVNDTTREKNRIHKLLDSCNIRLSSVLSNIFGKVGRYILDGLLEGKDIDAIIEGIPVKRLMKKGDQIREAVRDGLDITKILLIRGSLELMAALEKRIDELEAEIRRRVVHQKENIRILMSIPGIGFISAVTILAEIGDFRDFEKPEKLAAWCGLVPSVYQSADKLITGKITKHGSRHLRWILVEVAQTVARCGGPKLKKFFLRIIERKEFKVAIVALARKILCILHHLLMNRETYEDEVTKKETRIKLAAPETSMSIEEMIEYMIKAGYEVKKKSGVGG
jgi:transposase